jgi:hypothetical protein
LCLAFLHLGGWFRYGCILGGFLLYDATELRRSGVAFVRMLFAGMIPLDVLARGRYYGDMIYRSSIDYSLSGSSVKAPSQEDFHSDIAHYSKSFRE